MIQRRSIENRIRPSMIMGSSRLLDVRLDQETVARDVGRAGGQSCSDFDPFAVAAPGLDRLRLKEIAIALKRNLPIAKPLQSVGTHCYRHFLTADEQLSVDVNARCPAPIGVVELDAHGERLVRAGAG